MDKLISDLTAKLNDSKTSQQDRSQIQRRLDELRREASKRAHGADKAKKCVAIGIGIGLGIILATIIEDFLTGGAGLADDLASFALAGKIMFASR